MRQPASRSAATTDAMLDWQPPTWATTTIGDRCLPAAACRKSNDACRMTQVADNLNQPSAAVACYRLLDAVHFLFDHAAHTHQHHTGDDRNGGVD